MLAKRDLLSPWRMPKTNGIMLKIWLRMQKMLQWKESKGHCITSLENWVEVCEIQTSQPGPYKGKMWRTWEKGWSIRERSFRTNIILHGPIKPSRSYRQPSFTNTLGTITEIEICDALKSLKNGKATGTHNIPAEGNKAERDILVNVLYEFLNENWTEE